MNALNMYEYPEIPFIISGIQGIHLRKFDMFKSNVMYLQDQIELWYLERKFESWIMNNHELSQQVLLCLKLVRIKNHPLFNFWGDLVLSENRYNIRDS